MKNIKTKIILSALVVLFIIGFVGTAHAASSSLYISPASITKTAGNIFNVSVGVNASGNKVCAVEGTLVFNNLSCQSVTMASGVMAQSTPSCSNPHFLIGIPNCSVSDKVLFTASVKALGAGTASISSTGVDIIGEGVSVGSVSINGNYTINAASTPNPTSKSNPQTTEGTTAQIEAPVPQTTQENNLVASAEATGATTSGSGWIYAFFVLLALVIVYALSQGIYYIKKNKQK